MNKNKFNFLLRSLAMALSLCILALSLGGCKEKSDISRDPFFVNDKDLWEWNGDANTGYTLKFEGPIKSIISNIAVMATPIDINTQSFQFKVNNDTPNTRPLFFAFTSSYEPTKLLNNVDELQEIDAVVYSFIYSNACRLVLSSATKNQDVQLGVPRLDPTETHTFGFKKINESWYLVLDGEEVINLTENDLPIVHTNLDKLAASGKAYIQLCSYAEGINSSELKIVNNSDITISGDSTGDSTFDNINIDWKFD